MKTASQWGDWLLGVPTHIWAGEAIIKKLKKKHYAAMALNVLKTHCAAHWLVLIYWLNYQIFWTMELIK